ncbi:MULTISPECIES: DUF4845 domain-containing protein [unclassified Undibacterium]|uniref:DUF4845 domain-containing protein n=1 Tax=unclassified Undibacterium TaxID=2630295 RepID=UPI003C30E811
MQKAQRFSLKSQRGISLVGLILSLGVIVLIAMLAMKVVPTVIEYTSIKKAIGVAKTGGSTVNEIQNTFDKQAEVGYITSITGKDLVITRDNGDIDISFSYQKKIPLFGPATLLLEYEGTTAKSGVSAKKPE